MERSDVSSRRRLFTEDRAQQSFFRRKLCFAFRRNLADQNIARLHFGADSNDSVGTEVLSASSPTFGISRVISSDLTSYPGLQSRFIDESGCGASFTTFSEIKMASSGSRSKA